MKNVNKILLLLVLFPIDIIDFLKFLENKAEMIIKRKKYLRRIMIPEKYLQLIEGSYFLQSDFYFHFRNDLYSDKIAFTKCLIIEKNIPFLIYCLKRYAYQKEHPVSEYFINELSMFIKTECDAETTSLRSAI